MDKNLFLTSKVRLHCGAIIVRTNKATSSAFPDLKGQAPLRQDSMDERYAKVERELFLTSKVRLHCGDEAQILSESAPRGPFPDLKGQAPLRPA